MTKPFVFSLLLVTATWGWAQTTTTTTETFSSSINLPVVGLGSTQTVELDVVNLASNASNGTAASCSGSISFLNSTGATIGTATAITDLGAGAAMSASLPFASSGGTGTRTLVRAVVTLTTTVTSGKPSAPCSLAVSLNLFETSTGATDTVIPSSSAASTPVGPISPLSPQR
jgi:hypothetical protein